MGELSHLDDQGAARMVDVSAKPETERVATAGCRVVLAPETLELLASAGLPKGDALAVARVAGIMGAKRTPELIPLCHPLPITGVEVDLALEADAVRVTATVRTTGRTGVEMEALTAAATAALTLYDMVKGVQRDVRVEDLRLLAKRGGRSGDYVADMSDLDGMRVAVLTVSDRVAAGTRDDAGGSALCELLEGAGASLVSRAVVADEHEPIAAALRAMTADAEVVLTTGGTGLGPRDVTPEATRAVLDREAPGIAEALRHASLAITPFAMLSRATAGLVGRTLVVNLPGNPKAVREEWSILAPVLAHAVETARGPVPDESHRRGR